MKQEGLKQAINTASFALHNVPAYRTFLKEHGYKKNSIASESDFLSLPFSDKKNYITNYNTSLLTPKTSTPPVAYASSGSSGKATFWFRNDEQEKRAVKTHKEILTDVFGIAKHEPTLIVICFSMGIWVAGNFTYSSFRELAKQGHAITLVTPGIDKGDIYSTLINLAPKYKNLVIAGYPPFVMEILHGCKTDNIQLPKRTRILTAGDTFTEHWRDKVLELTNNTITTDIVNLYGCADGGVMGFETPLSIFIRRAAIQNTRLRELLFGEHTTEPAFVQYKPNDIFFETQAGELVFTANTGLPLVRYNLRDTGHIFTHAEIVNLLTKANILNTKTSALLKQWKYPFIVKNGRSDIAVTYYALNIYPEHLRAGVEDRRIAKYLTGNFISYNQNDKHHKKHSLHIVLEMSGNIKEANNLHLLVTQVMTEQLLRQNIEYRKLHNTIGEAVLPKIHLIPSGADVFKQTKGLLQIKGKKPKLVI